MKNEYLTIENVNSLIGKKINWFAPACRHNEDYEGVAIITAVDLSAYNPITAERVVGDDLSHAFIGIHNRFAYTDSDRFVLYREI